MESKKRLVWPDMCKGFAMILVIIWHMRYTIPNVKGLFSPFFMPIFFFIAGYFQKDAESFTVAIKKRCKELLIPFLLFGVIECFLYCENCLGIYKNATFFDCLKGLIFQISDQNDILWFITCLFVAQLIVLIIIKILNEPRLVLMCSVILCFAGCIYNYFISVHLPWHIEIACIMQLYVVAGWFCKKHDEIFVGLISNKHVLFIAAPSYVLAIIADKIFLKSTFDVHPGIFGHYFDFFILSVWGGIVLLCLSRLLPEIHLINFIGKNTYCFYAFHYTVIFLSNNFIEHYGINNLCHSTSIMNSLLMIPVLMFVIIICSAISIVINRIKIHIKNGNKS